MLVALRPGSRCREPARARDQGDAPVPVRLPPAGDVRGGSRRPATDGEPWYRVSIPMRPNGTYGWIPAKTVSLSPTHSQIVVNLSSRTIDIYRFDKHKWHGKVAIGAPGRETPRRPLLRRGPLRPVPRHVPRRLRRRDERLLEAHRVAGRRRRRHPRHEPAAAARPGRLARLRARLEPDGDASSGLTRRSARRSGSRSSAEELEGRPAFRREEARGTARPLNAGRRRSGSGSRP